MKRQADHSPIFRVGPDGHVVQDGTTSGFTTLDSSPYAGIKARALSLVNLFELHDLSPSRSKTLSKLISYTIEMSDAWDSGQKDKISFEHLTCAAQVDRIASAAIAIGNCQNPRAVLEELLNGSIDLLERHQSKAKDTLWELELLRTLTTNGIFATLGEPDLIVNFENSQVGMACKKIYSEKNFSKVLSNAIAQIEREGEFGIVALNIDDLIPANSILVAPTLEIMMTMLTNRNYEFLRNHERYFRKYLTPGRAISALVSCSAIVDVRNAENRFMNARQTTVWQIPGMSKTKEEQMANFITTMNFHYEKNG